MSAAAQPRLSGDARFDVDFPVQLSWQAGAAVRCIIARCLAFSASAMKLEAQDRLEQGMIVLVHSHEFGRIGLASVGGCNRNVLKYEVELRFSSPPPRLRILEDLIRKAAERRAASKPQPAVSPKNFV